jgi:hypothetical protein
MDLIFWNDPKAFLLIFTLEQRAWGSHFFRLSIGTATLISRFSGYVGAVVARARFPGRRIVVS